MEIGCVYPIGRAALFDQRLLSQPTPERVPKHLIGDPGIKVGQKHHGHRRPDGFEANIANDMQDLNGADLMSTKCY